MAILKCKMCGGDLIIHDGMTVSECEYCGTTQTLPKLVSDDIANLYDRANHFRRNNEFDKAEGIYERILSQTPEDSEAYWSLVLCRYGIEYVEDPATRKRVPTVNRTQYTSVFDDENYKSAIAHADAIQRRVYEEEAAAINEIQKGILAISQKEEPFDVFICYKETDRNGRRTPDSVLATDLYHQLTNEGFKVFFARITLEDKLGSAYEPYIFAALNSAKVMVVLGTKPEYFNAVWVKNEWSRYLALVNKSGGKKVLIPAYRDMDPYDLPEEFSHLQAQDMSKLGFMQDLIRGIKKITGSDKPKAQPQVVSAVTGASDVAPLLKRMFMYLEDGEWDKANEYAERVLDKDPENGEAYLGKLMVDLKVRRREDLNDQDQPFDKENNFNKAIRFGDEQLKNELNGYIDSINKRNTESKYIEACELQEDDSEQSLGKAVKIFRTLKNYKDSAERAEKCQCAYEEKVEEREENKNRLLAVRERIAPYHNTISARWDHTVGLKSDGTVVAIGENKYGQCDVTGWKDIVTVSAGYEHTVGLKSDGTVVATKYIGDRKYYYGQCDVQVYWRWKDIVAVSAGWAHTVGLKSDGTVVATEYIGDWYDSLNQSDKAKDWTDIVAVSVGYKHTVGLKPDGTVIDTQNRYVVKNWKDIVAVSAGYEHTVGLKSDGTVVAVGKNEEGQCDVSGWTDIVAVSAGVNHTVGIKSDGTVVAVGKNEEGQCDVSGWKDIVAVSAGYEHTVGLKSDGTVVAVGYNRYGQCDVSKWKLFKPDTEKYTEACRLQDSGSIDELKRAAEVFICLGNYKDSADRAITCNSSVLNKYNQEKAALQTELANLKGFFTGKRRKQIEARLAEIESELMKL